MGVNNKRPRDSRWPGHLSPLVQPSTGCAGIKLKISTGRQKEYAARSLPATDKDGQIPEIKPRPCKPSLEHLTYCQKREGEGKGGMALYTKRSITSLCSYCSNLPSRAGQVDRNNKFTPWPTLPLTHNRPPKERGQGGEERVPHTQKDLLPLPL